MQSGENERTVIKMCVRRLTVNGLTDTVAGWARRTGLSMQVIYSRLSRGYDDEEAVVPSMIEYRKELVRRLWHGRWVYTANQM